MKIGKEFIAAVTGGAIFYVSLFLQQSFSCPLNHYPALESQVSSFTYGIICTDGE